MAVAAWSEDVTPKPIFAISDGPGMVAELVAKPLGIRNALAEPLRMGFRQFGDVSKSMVEVMAGVETEEDVKKAVEKALPGKPTMMSLLNQCNAISASTKRPIPNPR